MPEPTKPIEDKPAPSPVDPNAALADQMEQALKELELAAAPKPKRCPHCGKELPRRE